MRRTAIVCPRRLDLVRLEDRSVPATIPVTNLGDSGPGSLRQAVLDANDEVAHPGPDTIVLGGTVTLTSLGSTQFGPNALEVTSTITILGIGATVTRSGGSPNFRLFYVAAAGSLTLRDLTLSNGFARGGDGGTNFGDDGGGGGGGMGAGGAIYNQGTLTIERCNFTGNTAQGGSGGAGADLAGTDAGGGGGGGGIGGHGGTTPDDNTNGGSGGGGFRNGAGGTGSIGGGGGGSVTDAVGPAGGTANGGGGGTNFVNGTAGGLGGGGGGGGDEAFGGEGGIGGGGGGGGENDDTNTNFGGMGGFGGGGGGGGEDGSGGGGGVGGGGGGGAFGNGSSARAGGKGGFAGGQGGTTSNTRGSGGGGGGAGLGGAIFNDAGTVIASNVTISGNSTFGGFGGTASGTAKVGVSGDGMGGGIFNYNGTLNVRNCTFTDNFAAFGRGIANLADFDTTTVTLNNSILGQTVNGATDYASFAINGTRVSSGTGNLIRLIIGNFDGTVVSTADPQLGPLQDNGGPSFTHLPATTSPAIDAGDNAEAVGLATDQRFGSFGRIDNGTVDIGAVEVQPLPAVRPILVGGLSDGTALPFSPLAGKLQPGTTQSFFAGSGVHVRTATADVTGDGVPDLIGGTGPGTATRVVVLDGSNGAKVAVISPYEAAFTGGVYVAAGDIDGDGKAEVVVTPDQGGGPIAAVYSGAKLTAGNTDNAAQIIRFFGIQDPAFRGGARPALGDLTGGGRADLIISAGFLGGPRIAIWGGTSVATAAPTHLIGDFFAFEETLRNGAFVTAGDFNGDGRAEVVFGGGPGGGPRARVVDGVKLLSSGAFGTLDQIATTAQLANFFAGDDKQRGGVRLATADTDGNGLLDLITGSGDGEPSQLRVYKSSNLLTSLNPVADQLLDPFGVVLAEGVYVG